MSRRYSGSFTFFLALGAVSLAVSAQDTRSIASPANSVSTPVGPRNQPLYDGAQALQAGLTEEGVQLTLEGLRLAQGGREQDAALANLCTGYLRLRQFDAGLNYCNQLIERSPNAWRAYNARAMIYLELKQYEKADEDLKQAEALNPNASTVKVARSQYLDAVHPVAPEVEIDDRNRSDAPARVR